VHSEDRRLGLVGAEAEISGRRGRAHGAQTGRLGQPAQVQREISALVIVGAVGFVVLPLAGPLATRGVIRRVRPLWS